MEFETRNSDIIRNATVDKARDMGKELLIDAVWPKFLPRFKNWTIPMAHSLRAVSVKQSAQIYLVFSLQFLWHCFGQAQSGLFSPHNCFSLSSHQSLSFRQFNPEIWSFVLCQDGVNLQEDSRSESIQKPSKRKTIITAILLRIVQAVMKWSTATKMALENPKGSILDRQALLPRISWNIYSVRRTSLHETRTSQLFIEKRDFELVRHHSQPSLHHVGFQNMGKKLVFNVWSKTKSLW